MTRETAVGRVLTALQAIHVAQGYNTDAGSRVYRYPFPIDQLGDGDFPCVIIGEAFGRDVPQPTNDRESDIVHLSLDIIGCARTQENDKRQTGALTLPAQLNALGSDLKKALSAGAVQGAAAGDMSLIRKGRQPMFDSEAPTGIVVVEIELVFAEA